MAMLDDIATYLDTSSTDLKVGSTGNVFKNYMPPRAPNEVVGLFETVGAASFHEFSTAAGPNRVYTAPGLQCLSRSTSSVTAKTNCETVFRLLDGYTGKLPTSTSTGHYPQIVALQAPFLVGRDENQRFIYSVNFNVWRTV